MARKADESAQQFQQRKTSVEQARRELTLSEECFTNGSYQKECLTKQSDGITDRQRIIDNLHKYIATELYLNIVK
ncbi:unnamed protein product, partial [Didymodactylos carnosus]